MLALDDTILAVSSPPGRSPRGLIRMSGPAVRDVLAAVVEPPVDLIPRRLIACGLRLELKAGNAIPGVAGSASDHAPFRGRSTLHALRATLLPALLTIFPAPHSYTGQDLAELQCPGHPALLERLLHRLQTVCELASSSTRVRLAAPGEFTFRAFVAGKLDLTQAEGVAATIAATSDGQLAAAALLRDGRLGRFAADLVRDLADALALVEAGIDFVDQEDVVPISPGTLDDRLAALEQRLADLLAHSRSWGALEALPRVVLVGAPSTGKSTLFNALLGHERAVISPTPGTTRDVLEEPLTLVTPAGSPIEILLVDLAGLDEAGNDPRDALDRDIQAAARAAIARADLVLRIDDGRGPSPLESSEAGTDPLSDARLDLTSPRCVMPRGSVPSAARTPLRGQALPPAPLLRIRTKADLAEPSRDTCDVAVSAHTGANLDALRHLLAARLADRGVSVQAELLALQPRHEAALRAAAGQLHQARALLAPQRDGRAITGVELVASALRAALDELACLGGQMTPDDVIGRVFATFCVGK